MASVGPSGTEGYAKEAAALAEQYESFPFSALHKSVMHLIPPEPIQVLDIGAGTGRDAAGFAALGHSVVAVEPTPELRTIAAKLHTSPRIEWLDDSLPELALLSKRGQRFEVVMLTAVWMHLDEGQRLRAMPRVAALVQPGGVMVLSLRHGPVPPARRMFEVTAAETVRLAGAHAMRCVFHSDTDDRMLGRPGVSWDRLAFRKE